MLPPVARPSFLGFRLLCLRFLSPLHLFSGHPLFETSLFTLYLRQSFSSYFPHPPPFPYAFLTMRCLLLQALLTSATPVYIYRRLGVQRNVAFVIPRMYL